MQQDRDNIQAWADVYEDYILYRSSAGDCVLNLTCTSPSTYKKAVWYWTSQSSDQENKQIAFAIQDGNVTIDTSDFRNRMKPAAIYFDGSIFCLQIEPVLFEDAGDFACYFEKTKAKERTAIILITIKVTAEFRMAPVEGNSVTLTCSVSKDSKGLRLIWLGNDNKTIIKEKILSGQERELRLFIQNVRKDEHSRMCVALQDNLPRAVIPYDLKVKEGGLGHTMRKILTVIIISLRLMLLIL
ncbi:uncharacterized protein [Heterodontus francisci]|uniref:uncharacterized protein n=1 Tax=Heterodontus francisci TaxID=7792 RepID=UPI00355C65D9